ncbi:hypothetical protein ABVB69_12995 [Streptomyces sp. NPDC000349]|uniref:hypothetical protein n=1 Tax=unclassified Streptomyces TaxID=2593676 RepID=UPI002781338A|nr:hypothetical protein [Streptomyces sp. DSM 40167]MDQ0405251.1 hypothetical protein [Streptomyces sp. DSM 40167]
MTSKPVMWTGVGLCGAGAITLVVVAFVDLGRADQAASVTGAVVGLAGLALALFAQFGRGSSPADVSTTASGDGAIAAGGNIGTASTGGTTAPPPPSPTPPPSSTPPNGGVNASGRGSIAAGGDIGSASTGN